MSASPSKYGDLIRQARQPENQESGKPKNQKTRNLETQIAAQSSLEISAAAEPEREVNLCVKVPESLRRHWAAESKRQGVTMTAVIVEALTAKFGEPN